MSIRTLRSKKLRKKKKKVLQWKLGVFCLLILAIIFGCIYVLRLNYLQIQEVYVEGEYTSLSTRVSEDVGSVLEGKYLWLIPKTNIFLYPKSNIEDALSLNYPEIEKYSIELDIFHTKTLKITVKERQEIGVWCRYVSEKEECYFIDNSGYVFEKSPNYSDGVLMKYSGRIQGEPLGAQYVPRETFQKIISFVNAVNAKSDAYMLRITGLNFEKDSNLTFRLQNGGSLFVDLNTGLTQTFENVSILLSQDSFLYEIEDGSFIDYVDARLPGKVFYKVQ